MKKALLLAAIAVLSAGFAHADFRPYAWTYQYMTMPPGNVEVEVYNEYVEPVKADLSHAYWQRQLEMETGVTDRLDFSFYLTSSRQPQVGPNDLTDIRLRARIKLTEEKNDFIFDPLIYVEYTLQEERIYPDTWEVRGVAAKDIGLLNVSLNLIAEERINYLTSQKPWGISYAAGASYQLFWDNFRLGIESTGELDTNKYSLGPSLGFKGKRIWGAVSALYGLNSNSEYIKVQAVFGVVFDLNYMPELKP
jgi:hypothetical protein